MSDTPSTPADWRATVAGVGGLLRARTTAANGAEVGTFTPDTRPTDVQVQELLDGSIADLAVEVGGDLPAKYHRTARRLAELDAALQVELGYFPEQVATGRSPYQQLKDLYDSRLKSFKMMVQAGDDEGDPTGAGSPSYGFPADAGGMVGWGTKW